jgi:predicted esterase
MPTTKKPQSTAQQISFSILHPLIVIGLITIAIFVLVIRNQMSGLRNYRTQVLVPPESNSPLPPSSKPPMDSYYPEPYVVEPREKHDFTMILLHGTSQDGPDFAAAFLSFPIPMRQPLSSTTNINHITTDPNTKTRTDTKTLPELFPTTRFVFPTGRSRYSTVLGRASHAWFDFQSFSDRTLNETIQLPGLAESSVYLGELVDSEVKHLLKNSNAKTVVLGEKSGNAAPDLHSEDATVEEESAKQDARRKIVVGGFSQGSAMAGIAMLAGKLGGFEGGQIGGFVGLSGWCPFRAQILDAIMERKDLEGAQRFAYAVHFLRRLLDFSEVDQEERIGIQKVPVFLGHGKEDTKMKLHWGLEMGELLEEMIFDVHFKSYEGLEHWWNGNEIADLVGFLKGVWHVDKERTE